MSNYRFNLIVVLALFFSTQQAFSQTAPPLPKSAEISSPTDYAKYNNDIINCVNWLDKQALNDHSDNINAVNTFILNWITQSPYSSLALNGLIMQYNKQNPQLMMIFMGGAVKYALQNPGEKSPVKINLAGLEDVLKVYKTNKGVISDDAVETLLAIKAQGKLESFVKDQIGTK